MEIKKTGRAEYGQYAKILVYGAPGHRKRQDVESRVSTPSGWRRFGDLKVGDFVIGSDGKPTEVLGIYDHGVGPAYRVTTTDGGTVICDAEHFWSVQTKRTRSTTGNLQTLTVQQMLDSGYIVRRGLGRRARPKYFLPIVSPVQYDKVDLPLNPYLLGVLLANGSLADSSVIVTTNDEHVITRCIQENPEWDFTECTVEGYARRWRIPGMKQKIRELGLADKRSAEKFIPDEYLTAHMEARLDILSGLLDCDGSAARPRRRCEYSSRSKRLAKGVQQLVWSLGGVASLSEIQDRKDEKIDYHVSFSLPENPYTTPAKAEHYSPRPGFRGIISIEPVGDREMRCIKVAADDHLYVTQDYLVTHNTLLGSTAKDALFLSIEAGLMTIADREVDFKEIFDPVDLQEAFAFLRSAEHSYRWVVVDTLDELQKVFIADRLKRERREVMSLQDWGYVGEQMQKALRAYRNLPMNVVFLCHSKTDQDQESGILITKPMLQGAIGDQIAGFMDLSTFISADVVKGENEEPQTAVTLRFQASPRFPHIKDRSGKMPDFYRLNLETDLEDIHKLIFGGQKLPKSRGQQVPDQLPKQVAPIVEAQREERAEILAPNNPIDPPKPQKLNIVSPEQLLKDKLGAEVIGELPNCTECGTTVQDQDVADLSKHRYDKVLCQEHFEQANKNSKRR